MFKNEFQGGQYFEIFSAQGKDPTAAWKVGGGSAIRKVYDKDVRSYVYTLEGSGAKVKMQLPKDPRQSLTLIQRFLILQMCVAKGVDFSLDLGVTDLGNNKRRLLFSTAHKEIHVTPLHAKIPLTIIKRGTWLNLCLDLVSLVGDTWRGQTHKAIESISISANCRLRRVFTMKSQPPDTTDDEALYGFQGTNSGELDGIPRQCQLSHDVRQSTQVINMNKLRHAEWKLKGSNPESRPASSTHELDLSLSGRKSTPHDCFHIAFGSKIPIATPGSAGKRMSARKDGSGTSRSLHSSHREAAGDSHVPPGSGRGAHRVDKLQVLHSPTSAKNHHRLTSDPGANVEDPETSVDKGTLEGSKTWSGHINSSEERQMVPHPPREPSSDRTRRKLRVKSGDKTRSRQASTSSNIDVESSVTPRKRLSSTDSDDGYRLSHSGHTGHRHKPAHETTPAKHTVENASENDEEEDESISDVINAVKNRLALQQQYNEDEEEEDEDEAGNHPIHSPDSDLDISKDSEDVIYTFTSPPKSAPLRTGSPAGTHHNLDSSQQYVKRNLTSSRNAVVKRNLLSARGAKPEDDFFNSDGSEEEEEDVQAKIWKSSPSPRATPSPRTTPSEETKDEVEDFFNNSLGGRAPLSSRILTKEAKNSRVDGAGDSEFTASTSRRKDSRMDNEQQHKQASQTKNNSRVDEAGGDSEFSRRKDSRKENEQQHKQSSQSKNRYYEHSSSEDEEDGEDNVDIARKSRQYDRSKKNDDIDSKQPTAAQRLSTKSLDKNDNEARSSKERPVHKSIERLQGVGLRSPIPSVQLSSNGPSVHSSLHRSKGSSPRSSQGSVVISRKSLREIPKDDARLSQVMSVQSQHKPYEPKKYQSQDEAPQYQMEDLSESFEANMLLSLKRQAMEEEFEEEGGAGGGANQDKSHGGQQGNSLDKHLYGDDSLSSSSDDTSFSTWRGQAPVLRSHHYQDEMHLPTSRMSHDPLGSSNPRDWTGVFSPPIVLPSDIRHHNNPDELSPGKLDSKSPRKLSPVGEARGHRLHSSHNDKADDTDEEEELDLLYDPCLNCYFDPKTCKYYELAF